MVDVQIGKFRLRYEGNCYIVEEEGKMTEDMDIPYKNQTYHTQLHHALHELVLHRHIPRQNIRTLEDLIKEVKQVKALIMEAVDVSGN